ncbi:FliH/SctL family protein [Yoonia maritima]|uniref:FliH/SctL family protein n=1 Tax=Yoonia maritima TaxID=1435347 RepID=UPI000D101EF6|nr:FliH/SctL family protein [Yoonia maritima]
MTAQRITKADLSRRISLDAARKGALRSADEILDRARAQAAQITSAAEAASEQQRAALGQLSDAQLAHFIDRTRIEGTAHAMLQIMSEATRLTERFDVIGPWVGDMVDTALRRILGTYEAQDLHRQIVAQALAEGRADWHVTIRVAPQDAAALRAALHDKAGQIRSDFAGLREIVADPKLQKGSCLLVSDHGAVDISLETQVSALVQQIRHHDARPMSSDDETGGPF